MTGFIMKIIICPTILLISDYLFKDIYYPYIYEPIFMGIAIAILIHLIELFSLRPGTVLIISISDFIISFALLYFSHFLLPGAALTLIGASIISTIIAIIEYFQHIYLVRNYKTQKLE